MMSRKFAFLAVATIFLWTTPAVSSETNWADLRDLVAAAPAVAGSEKSSMPEQGPVIVTFFASWCPPCTDEFRHLNDLVESEAGKGASIVAINLFEDFGGKKNPERMAVFLKRTNPQFPLVKGSEEIRKTFGDIDRIPTVVVYGASGQEVWRFVHERGAEKTHATLEDLVGALEKARDPES